MGLIKDTAVNKALQASGIYEISGKDVDRIYQEVKAAVPSKVMKHIDHQVLAGIVLRLCALERHQSSRLTMEGQILLRRSLDTFAQQVLDKLVLAASTEMLGAEE